MLDGDLTKRTPEKVKAGMRAILPTIGFRFNSNKSTDDILTNTLSFTISSQGRQAISRVQGAGTYETKK